MLGSRKMPRRSFVLRSRRSLNGISCCSKSAMLCPLLCGGEIFFHGNVLLRATSHRFYARRPIGDDARAACDVIADFDEQLGIAGEPQVGARAKADEADAFAASYAVASFFPADDATGDKPGDLLEGDFTGIGAESDHVLLIVRGGAFAHSGGEFAGAIIHLGDDAGSGGAIDVHVPDGEKDRDALAGTASVFFIGDHDYTTVGGGDDGAGVRGDDTVRIAEEIKDEGGEEEKDYASDSPAQKQGCCADRERGQPEVVAFFDHANLTIPQQLLCETRADGVLLQSLSLNGESALSEAAAGDGRSLFDSSDCELSAHTWIRF
jgi:hypothetical protein